MYRQGDVLLIPVNDLPENLSEVPRENGRLILAHGEATGHAHAVTSREAVLLESLTGDRYLSLSKSTILTHEEHAHPELPAGNYRVVRQREYTPAGIINVAD